MAEFLVSEKDGKVMKVPTKTFTEIGKIRPLLSETSWEIMKLLAQKPHYAAELAKKLNLHEQKVYYYIKRLKTAGLIEIAKTEEKHGALAKYFRSKYSSLCLLPRREMGKAESTVGFRAGKMPKSFVEFFEPFIKEGKLGATIVVGSPDQHGEYKARARDSHLAVDLAAFLGALCTEIEYPLTKLDTNIASLKELDANIIILGGPITNKLAEEINDRLPVKFVPSGGHWLIRSELSGREYVEDSVGFIAKVPHPYFADKSIMIIAGKRNAGTKAVITALVRKTNSIISANKFDDSAYAKVVEGLDLDGDGAIDEAEILE